MHYEPFYAQYPKIAEKETRVLTFLTNETMPIGSYAFVPSYCNDKKCDCRRTLINVYEDKIEAYRKSPLATISYGWMEDSFYEDWFGSIDEEMLAEFKGPALDSMQTQSKYAPILLKAFSESIIIDPRYVERLKRHYALYKYKKGMLMPTELKKYIKPLEACTCDSGKIFKLCCGKRRSRMHRRRHK